MELNFNPYNKNPETYLFLPVIINVLITFTAYYYYQTIFGFGNISSASSALWQAPIFWNYSPCVTDSCQITGINSLAFTIIPPALLNVFSHLVQGDIFGTLAALGTALTQTNIGVSVAASIIGGFLIAMSFGLSLSFIGSGVTINEQGTRLAQSVGLALLIFAVQNFFFGNWFFLLPPVVGVIIQVLELGAMLVGAILRAIQIA